MMTITDTDTLARQKFCFFADPHFKQDKSYKTTPPLNFLSRFLSSVSFSTFASRPFLFVEKITNKSRTGYAKLAKELNPTRKTKTRAKKFALHTLTWGSCLLTVLFSVDTFAQSGSNSSAPFNVFFSDQQSQNSIYGNVAVPNNLNQLFGVDPMNGSLVQTHNINTDIIGLSPEEMKIYFQIQQQVQQFTKQTMQNNSYAVQNANQIKQSVPSLNVNAAPTSKEIEAAWQNQIYRKDYSNTNGIDQRQKRLNDLLKEASAEENNRSASNNSTAKTKPFNDALQSLKNMLDGKTSMSLKDAYYNVENAFGNTYLSYKEYTEQIKQSVQFIKTWLQQNGYDLKSNEALNLGIQKFINDTLVVTLINPDSKETTTTKHLPFNYDYVDFRGEEDHRNYFVTKSLATGMGQCNNLPEQYLLFAEALGAKAYLSLLPNHSFIKYPDDQGNIQNYEPTNGSHFTDKEYEDYFHVSPQAKQNNIYLDTLNKEMIVADCVIDLAYASVRKNGITDTAFIKNCIKTFAYIYPENKNNLHVHFMSSIFLSRMVHKQMVKDRIQDLKEISKSPEASKLYKQLTQNEQYISSLGYQDMPKEYYELLMNRMDTRGKMQLSKNVTGKEKRSLFIKEN